MSKKVAFLVAPEGIEQVELTEPSLFLAHGEGSAARVADAIAARL